MQVNKEPIDLMITTGDAPAPGIVERAKRLALELGSPFIPRGDKGIAKLAAAHGAKDVLVLLQEGVRLIRPGETPLMFHPSMGFIRAKRVLKGEPDPMLTASRLEPGDVVLDCTAGLGTDSLLFSIGTGPTGRVTALESSFPVYALLTDGMRHYRSGNEAVDDALSRIQVKYGDHLGYLCSLPDRSVDIVYFDPMFREPVVDSSAISPLRSHANPDELHAAAVQEARRVARKTIILKEKRYSGEFARLGFRMEQRGTTKTVYGVIDVDSGK